MLMQVEKIPMQMSEYEIHERLAQSECPLDICIDKYKRFKKWCEYHISQKDYDIIWSDKEIYQNTDPLCITYNNNCTECPLTKIKNQCTPVKCVISPWRRVQYACLYLDETEERQQELYDAIDNMIDALVKCKEI